MSGLYEHGVIGRRTLLGGAGALGLALPGRAPAQTGKHTVTIWTHFGGANLEIFRRFAAKFGDETPDVEIKATPFSPSDILPKYLAAVAGGAPPDIFHAPGYVPPDF